MGNKPFSTWFNAGFSSTYPAKNTKKKEDNTYNPRYPWFDEEDYKKFNIRKDFDLSDEGIKELLAKPSNQVIEEVKKITNEKKNLTQVFVLLYQIASLIDANDIDIKYETRNALERYFDVDFVDIINNLHN